MHKRNDAVEEYLAAGRRFEFKRRYSEFAETPRTLDPVLDQGEADFVKYCLSDVKPTGPEKLSPIKGWVEHMRCRIKARGQGNEPEL